MHRRDGTPEAGASKVEHAAVSGASEQPARSCAPQVPRPRAATRATRGERFLAAVLALGAAAALVLGMALTPSAAGSGTHTVLGLPPCGMLVMTGHPCPTCGATTAFVLAAHGRLLDSLATQPIGLVLFLGTVGTLALGGVAAATGICWAGRLTVRRIGLAIIVLMVLAMVSWMYKWSITVAPR
jgi:hypothetical protein